MHLISSIDASTCPILDRSIVTMYSSIISYISCSLFLLLPRFDIQDRLKSIVYSAIVLEVKSQDCNVEIAFIFKPSVLRLLGHPL
jgi:hypothetical protein